MISIYNKYYTSDNHYYNLLTFLILKHAIHIQVTSLVNTVASVDIQENIGRQGYKSKFYGSNARIYVKIF